MNQNAYAKVGRPFPNYQGPPHHAGHPRSHAHQQPATTGWTAPTLIYEKMRQVNVSASALNSDIQAHAARQTFKGAWATWFTTWSAFFKKYQGTFARLGAVTYTDELFQQVLSYESQLVTWYSNYTRETEDGTPNGRPLPPPSGQPPQPNAPIPPSRNLPEPPSSDGLVIPWWAWVVAAGVVGGAGYMTYRYIKRAQAMRQILDEKVVPQVLSVYGGPAVGPQLAAGYGQFAAAQRDPQLAAGYVVTPPSMVTIPQPYSRYPGSGY